jgi:hypothetical protein
VQNDGESIADRIRGNMDRRNPEYDVALSFAGEDRPYVNMVAEQLTSRGISLFYDKYEKANLWGKDLYEHFVEVYRHKARYTVMFISNAYRTKVWTNHERRAAQSRAIEETREYILPARFDDTEIPGILPTAGFIDLRTHSPAEVAILICEKLGRNPLAQKATAVPSPRVPALTGEARFNYSNYDGRFRIGEGSCEFETRWSKASSSAIYCYIDGTNVRGVTLAPKGVKTGALSKVASYNFTSRVRTAELNRFVVLQNTNGVFAILKILGIKDDTRGDDVDELHFRFWIQADGSDDFSAIES